MNITVWYAYVLRRIWCCEKVLLHFALLENGRDIHFPYCMLNWLLCLLFFLTNLGLKLVCIFGWQIGPLRAAQVMLLWRLSDKARVSTNSFVASISIKFAATSACIGSLREILAVELSIWHRLTFGKSVFFARFFFGIQFVVEFYMEHMVLPVSVPHHRLQRHQYKVETFGDV